MGNTHPNPVTAGCNAPRDIGHSKAPKWQGASTQAWCGYCLCGVMRRASQVLHQGPAICRSPGSDIRLPPRIPQQAALGHPRPPRPAPALLTSSLVVRLEATRYVWNPERPRMDQIEKKQMTNSSTVDPVKDMCRRGWSPWPLCSAFVTHPSLELCPRKVTGLGTFL